MPSLKSLIEDWYADFAHEFGASGANIKIEERKSALYVLFAELKKLGHTREDIELQMNLIVQKCTPAAKKNRKVGFVTKAVTDIKELLDLHYGEKPMDFHAVCEKACLSLGLKFEKRERTNKLQRPGRFKKHTPDLEEEVSLSDSIKNVTEKIVEKTRKLLRLDQGFIESQNLLPTIDDDIRKEFGLNEKGEFDV